GGGATTIDIELYDLGTSANALGAYAGERPADVAPTVDANGMWHHARNASFATIGRFYLRLVGSDETPAVQAELDHLRRTITPALPAEPLPWGYVLFVVGLNIPPSKVTFTPESAYSLEVGRNVYAAPMGAGDLEGFVVAAADDAAGAKLAREFVKGFLDYGDDEGNANGLHWIRDRNVKTLVGVKAAGAWVVRLRRAAGKP